MGVVLHRGGRPKGMARTGGRAKGTLNRITAEVRSLAQVHGQAGIDRLAEIAFGAAPGEVAAIKAIRDLIKRGQPDEEIAKLARTAFQVRSDATCVAAIRELLDRGYGKAPQPHDGDGQGGPITLIVTTGVPRWGAPQ